MRLFLTLLLLAGLIEVVLSQQPQQSEFQTKTQLAQVYFNSGEFEKAAPLMLEIFKISNNSYYFERYIDCLAELQKFDEAETVIKKELSKVKGKNPEMLVLYGFILKMQKRSDEAVEKYREALKIVPENAAFYFVLGNNFIAKREFEFAEETYIQARRLFPKENFSFELATVYLYLRNHTKMMDEYMNVIKTDETQLPRVQSYLSSALQLDVDNELKDLYREQILKRVQSEPNVIGFNRLLIWFFLQERKFSSALKQAIALDKRTGAEDNQIMALGQMAVNNKQYADGQNAFGYIVAKGDKNQYYWPAYSQNLNCAYLNFISDNPENLQEGGKLVEMYEKGLEFMGYNQATVNFILDYAHLLAFYLNNHEKAVEILKKGIESGRLPVELIGRLKTEMADIYVYIDDPWEATLLYSQVIDANKNNSLGDDVKLKKAKLGYYMGNFDWAKAQLDVIKASTSKLTANDAMDLSLLIGNNLNLDTTAVPLKMFARGDLLFFRNKNTEALAVFDSIAEKFPFHTIVDDILYRKAKVELNKKNFSGAADFLEQIIKSFSYESLADDAVFELANLYNFQLNRKEEAKMLYSTLLTDYPGSIFTEESRIFFKELREMFPDKKPVQIPADTPLKPIDDSFIDERGKI